MVQGHAESHIAGTAGHKTILQKLVGYFLVLIFVCFIQETVL